MHDFLVLSVFTDPGVLLDFPLKEFTRHMGIKAADWQYIRDISRLTFGQVTDRGFDEPSLSLDILRQFLLDSNLSKELSVQKDQFTRLALKCLEIVTNTK